MDNILDSIDITKIAKQKEFLTDRNQWICLSGGIRSGKTWIALIKGLLLSQLVPGNRGFIGRLDGKDLKLTTMRDFETICPKSWIKRKNDQLGYIQFKNGSEIIYDDLKNVVMEKKGLTLGWVFLDQAEELSNRAGEEIIEFFAGRLSHPKPKNRYFFISCNNEGHNWIYKRWKIPFDAGEQKKNHSLYEFMPFENPFLPPGYLEGILNSGMPQYWIDRYIYGSWNSFSDQVYSQFDYENIHGIRMTDFKLDSRWHVYESIDHGITAPTSYHQYAIDFDGNVFAFDEHYEAKMPVSHHSQIIKNKRDGIKIQCTYADPAIFKAKEIRRGGRAYCVSDEYSDNGIYCIPYNNSWQTGYNRLCEYLAVDPTHKHPITGKLGAPRFYVIENCIAMREEFANYRWKRIRPGSTKEFADEAVDRDNHALDECRGFLATRPAPPRRTNPYNRFDEDLEEQSSWMAA